MKAPWFIIREHISNIYLIKRLAEFQMKISNKNNYLGIIWEVLNPFIQILMYWFIFGLGLEAIEALKVHLLFLVNCRY